MGKKKKIGLGMAAIAASAGVATYAVKNYKKAQKVAKNMDIYPNGNCMKEEEKKLQRIF